MPGQPGPAMPSFATTIPAMASRAAGSRTAPISRWLGESLAVLESFTAGPQILVGSSMGAWIALRMIEELHKAGKGDRVGGLLLLAPAPDFTSELMEPQLYGPPSARLSTKQGHFEEMSEYSPEPNIYTRALFYDGAANAVLTGTIDTHCPVHILQGMADQDVPWQHAMKLVEHLPADDRDAFADPRWRPPPVTPAGSRHDRRSPGGARFTHPALGVFNSLS